MVASSDSASSSAKSSDVVVTPEKSPNPISRLFFCWVVPLFWRGYKRDLVPDDLDKTQKADLSKPLGDELEKNWLNEIKRVKDEGNGEKPKLLRAIFNTFIIGYMIDGFLLFVQSIFCKPFIPVFLALLIAQFVPGTTDSLQKAKIYAAGLIGLSFLNVIIQHHVVLRTQQRGMRIRIACCSLLYRKLLRLSATSLGQTTAGQLVNLMSNDVNRFDNLLVYLHFLWIMPFQIALMCYLIYIEVGLAAVVGVVSISLQTLPVQSILGRWSAKLRSKIAQRTDERVRIMNEIIHGIQVIKMYAWEKPFELIVSNARVRELSAIKSASYIRGIYMGFMVFTERASLYITLLTYSLLGNPITAAMVFSLAQFYNKLQESLAFQYPNAMLMGGECMITIKRLRDFLIMEERDAILNEPEEPPQIIDNNSNDCIIELMDAHASWTIEFRTLTGITVKIPRGKLCAIIGSVGSGKSSILQLLLKELPLQNGRMVIKGDISYSSQNPWLFVDTIRNNILFGQPYNKFIYKRVVQACALDKDFEQFPNKDKTLVGERGISLSGGQRARINLARAVYRRADIYLLDDPLSAVDTLVGRKLFDNCINGILDGTTRILVTHQLHYLQVADLIIVMENGMIKNMGTYDELSACGENFTNLLIELQETVDPSDGDELSLLNTSTRVDTNLSTNDYDDDELKPETEIVEESARGKLKMNVCTKYWNAGQNNALVIFMVIAMVFGQLTATASDFWVTYWSNQQSKISNPTLSSYERMYLNYFEPNSTHDSFHDHVAGKFSIWNNIGLFTTVNYLYIYTGLILSCIIFITGRSFLFFLTCIKSSKGLHDQMFNKLLRTKMRFFDTNPSGRILNRFSKDVGAMDEALPRAMIEMIQIFLVFLSIMLLVSITNPWLMFPIVFVMALFYFIFNVYLGTAQSIKRIESTSRSPVFSHMSASLHGVVTIRALKSQNRLSDEFDRRQDIHTSAYYSYLSTGSTLGFWLDILCIIFLTVVCYTFIYFDNEHSSSGNVGLAVSQTLILMGMLQFGIRQTTEVFAQMTSVERVLQYTELEEEQDPSRIYMMTPEDWPHNGCVEFVNTCLHYSPTDPAVLKNLNFTVLSGWKVGIVGRTGAGKSSLISALFRLSDVRGHIRFSDIETSQITLEDLRSNISIIPQEPILFSATVRYNLDPLDRFDDSILWEALESVELKDVIHSLDHPIKEGGRNFSVGQRQLICLARAILRNNPLIVLDEATANVDPQTDSFIQKTIREKFAHCTVLTIAHRLNTIMDSDHVLVMDDGKVVEFDYPHLLLQKKQGYLSQMVKETGHKMSANLSDIARNTYHNEIRLIEKSENNDNSNIDSTINDYD